MLLLRLCIIWKCRLPLCLPHSLPAPVSPTSSHSLTHSRASLFLSLFLLPSPSLQMYVYVFVVPFVVHVAGCDAPSLLFFSVHRNLFLSLLLALRCQPMATVYGLYDLWLTPAIKRDTLFSGHSKEF